MRPSELSNLLWAQVDRVAPHLLPNGKKEGHEWVAGNVNGDKGNSLKVNLSGKKKWADFAEGDGGDMLDLWMACRGINLHQAMQEAKAFLGIKDDDHHFDAKREKKFSRPDRKKIARYVTRTESHLEYLQSRGISPEVVKRYEVVSGKVWNGERELDALVIPYKRDGELLQVKRISTERPDGKKVIMAEGDCEPCLFGWHALDAGVRAVVLCEGEIDCMSYAQYGISALSVPFGGGKGAKQQWIEFEYHNLDRFEEIFISMDVDDVGREAAREIASRLGEHRCRLVTLPYKDINECLMNGVNPPYSNIRPWVEKAAEQCIQQRQTVVMLVPEDMSVGWFSKALESVDEVRIITDGRINFIEPSTGLEKKGNSKGSMLLIWRPFISPRRMFTTVSKAALMAIGQGVRRAA